MPLHYKPLSKENIEQALRVARIIFPGNIETIDRAYHASLDPTHPRWKERTVLDYYIVEDDKKEIVGITGFYQHTTHPTEEIWLGWYGVIPEARGKGFGRQILEWTMQTAKDRGYKRLNLWTTTSPDEEVAQKLYEKLGFNIFKSEQEEGGKYNTLYRGRDLGSLK